MADRNRRILVAVLALAAVVLLGYAALTVFLIARGQVEAGPLRLVTLVTNILAGGLALAGAVVFARQTPSGK